MLVNKLNNQIILADWMEVQFDRWELESFFGQFTGPGLREYTEAYMREATKGGDPRENVRQERICVLEPVSVR